MSQVLVRVDRATTWGDIVQGHGLFVEFSLQFSDGEAMRAQRVTGGREELMEDLRRAGLRVLEDDEPLAVAHREIQHARRSRHAAREGRDALGSEPHKQDPR